MILEDGGTSSNPAGRERPSGAQLAMAFDGRLAVPKLTWSYRLSVAAVLGAMLTLPVVYLAIIVGTGLGVIWYADHAAPMMTIVRPGRATLVLGVLYVSPILAGSLLILFMVLPLFSRRPKGDRPMWVSRAEEPLLYAYVDKLCDTMRAPRPVRIDVTAAANASAHIDNGLFGVVNRKLVLTIGLPLVRSMDLRHFTGVVAHELGHFSQGLSMRFSYAATRINMAFFRLAYVPSRVDVWVISIARSDTHWMFSVMALFCQAALNLTRLLLKGMALASHSLSMRLSRQAEFDADRRAAGIVGGDVLGEVLQNLPFVTAGSTKAIQRAQAGWVKRALPDDLVAVTHLYTKAMSADEKQKLVGTLLAEDARWFDTHPPLFQRVAKLKYPPVEGVLRLNAPARCLFGDFDELCKLATISFYNSALGAHLQPEHLMPLAEFIATTNKKIGKPTKAAAIELD